MIERLISAFATNIGTKVISVMIAIVLWIIVLGSRNIEVLKEVRIDLITAPDVVASNEVPETVTFRLSGPKAFLRTISDRREETLHVNLASAKPGHLITYNFFSNAIRVPPGVKVISTPAPLLVKLEYIKKREIPVRIDFHGQLPEGYRIAKAEMRPKTVKIKGAESRVDALTEIPTSAIDLNTLRGSIDRDQPLDLARYNVQLDGPLPRLIVHLEAASANYRIKNVDIRYKSPYKVRLEEKSVTVWVRAKDTSQLDRSHVFADIDLAGKDKGQHSAEVRVNLPDDVTLVRVVPDHVTATLY